MTNIRGGAVMALEIATATVVLLIAAHYAIQTRAVIIDPDIWWHIRVGDWIAEHQRLPRTGILSQHTERPWVAYSWGFDLIVSTVHRIYGLPGIFGFVIGLQILISLAFLIAIRRIAQHRWWSLLIAALAIYAFYVEPLRPVLLTLLGFILELFIIMEADRRRDDRRLRWLAPLFLIWANLHIQFVYGMFVFGLYVMARLLEIWRSGGLDAAPARNSVLGAFVLAIVCSCIGPNGVLPYLVALNYAGQPMFYQAIQELAAINFRRPEHYVQLLLLMAACVAVGRSRRFDPFRLSLLAVTAVVAFRSTRDSWFVAITSGFVLADAIRTERGGQPVPVVAAALRPSVLYALAAALATGISLGVATKQGIDLPSLAAVVDRVYPLRAVEFVEASNLPGPMYNTFNWGGFLISRLPGHPVSIDPRADLYGEQLFTQSISTMRAEPGWERDPDLARANFVLLPRASPLAAELARGTEFQLVYDDHLSAIFQRLPAQPPRP